MNPISRRQFLGGATWAALGLNARGARADGLLDVVLCYADCMLRDGRDTYGKEHSPLFAEAIDRRTLRLLEGEALKKVEALTFDEWGVRPHDRMLGGANPMHCQNLYQVLYALADVTGEKGYAAEADRSLAYFLTHCQSPVTGLFYWGEHLGWDLRLETPLAGRTNHEFFRPWVLWERCWRLAPGPCRAFARGLWEHQIGDHATGLYSRHARVDAHGPAANAPYPRHGGFYVETWAHAFERTQDPLFPRAIETVVDGLERMRQADGMLAAGNLKTAKARVPRDGSLAVSLWEASARVPDPLAAKLRRVARANDLPPGAEARLPSDPSNPWSDGYGGAGGEIAGGANLLALRRRQCGPEHYRERILAVADRYLATPVNLAFPVYPGTFGKVIFLMLDARELTGAERYLERADAFARSAVELFLGDNCPLPRATHRHDHYEAITGADTLMLSLLALWAARQQPPRELAFVYSDR